MSLSEMLKQKKILLNQWDIYIKKTETPLDSGQKLKNLILLNNKFKKRKKMKEISSTFTMRISIFFQNNAEYLIRRVNNK